MFNMFGGGNFYAPFNTTFFSQFNVSTSALPGVFGPWFEVTTGITFPGRWIDVRLGSGPLMAGNIVALQLGLGAIGAEVPWQPAVAPPGIIPAFTFVWTRDALGAFLPSPGFVFPITLPQNRRVTCRALGGLAGVDTFLTNVVIWG